MSTVVWIRGKDLRLHDHPALSVAGPDALCIFVVDPFFFSTPRAKKMPHRMQFLIDSLHALSKRMDEMGGKLWTIHGRSTQVVPAVARAVGAQKVLAMRWSDPIGRLRDQKVAEGLDIPLVLLEGETLLPPGTLRTKNGRPYRVFSPFANTFKKTYQPEPPLPVPLSLPRRALPKGIEACELPTLDDFGLHRNPHLPSCGEQAAHCRLSAFLNGAGTSYKDDRNRMDKAGTSRLSADLKFGVISARTVWVRTMQSRLAIEQKISFSNELIWREFNHNILWDNPHVLHEPFKAEWNVFPWSQDEEDWQAWASGNTGYPIVDAAQRQLLASGFVHNRARMITASFLTKHLRIDYRRGEKHYLQWLTDGDWAQNNMGWQWAAGCGSDAQPWFRIFNPMTQGKKFDPDGQYIREWVPELAALDNRYIHAPWTAPVQALEWSGIKLGRDYPLPIVDHQTARAQYLAVTKKHFERTQQSSEKRTLITGGGNVLPAEVSNR